MTTITPFLWFDDGAEEAVDLYLSIFGGRILDSRRWGAGGPIPEGTLMSVTFELDGREYQAFNGGPGHPFADSISLFVSVDTQEEIDDAWSRLLDGGGRPVGCGWLTDKFGLSWQIVPRILGELMSSPEPGVAGRVTQAMLGMVKLDVAGLQAAARG